MSWEQTVNTGNPALDQQTLDQWREYARGQGLELQVSPLPSGGFHVKAVPPGTAQPHQPAPQAQQQWSQQPQQQPQQWGEPQQQPQAQQQWGQPQQPQQPHAQQWGQPGYQAGAAAMGSNWAHMSQGAQAQPQQAQQWGQQAQVAAAVGVPGAAGAYASHGTAQPAPVSSDVPVSDGDPVEIMTGAPPIGRQRVAYLRKVYLLLGGAAFCAIAAGWAATTLGPTATYTTDTGAYVEVPIIVDLMLSNEIIFWGSFGLLVLATFGASAVSKVPYINVAALFGVGIIMGVELAPMVFVAQVFAGLGETMSANPVRDAGIMTAGVFIGITMYIFIARKDFSYLGGILSMGFWIILGGCILTFFLDSEPFTLAVAAGGALLSAGFLLYVTSWIFKNSDMDDPVGDALAILVQLRNLFMFILRIAMSRR